MSEQGGESAEYFSEGGVFEDKEGTVVESPEYEAPGCTVP